MDDLKLVKKHYGEKMSHLCRDLFSTILETPGLLFEVLSDNFNYSKFLYDDLVNHGLIDEFKNYIYGLVDFEENCLKIKTNKNPYELMKEAGYILYKCETEEEIQSFKKYYAEKEVLCTFNGGRLKTCDVFFAVKKNVDEIKRKNFNNPEREDEYGTSVISLQFSKGNCNYLSIKNRYNHRVKNPDATFSNNLDNIIPGLTESFIRCYGYNIQNNSSRFEIPNYTRTFEGKYYKYNYEINNVYYCDNNVIIENGKIKEEYLDKNRYLVFDYFILDIKEKKIIIVNTEDGEFLESFNETINDLDIKKIDVVKTEDGNKDITFEIDYGKKIIITIDKENRMIKYYDDVNDYLPNNYLSHIGYITEISLSNVREIRNEFIANNEQTDINLKNFYAPKLEKIGNSFMDPVLSIDNFYTPKLTIVGDYVLTNCTFKEYELSSLEVAGDYFFSNNDNKEISFPKLSVVGDGFLQGAYCAENIDLPNLRKTGERFVREGLRLRNINSPRLTRIGEESLQELPLLKELDLLSIQFISDKCLERASALTKLNMPNVKVIGSKVLNCNYRLEYLNAPLVEHIGSYFMGGYNKLNYINLNKNAKINYYFAGLNNRDFMPFIGIVVGNENIIKLIEEIEHNHFRERMLEDGFRSYVNQLKKHMDGTEDDLPIVLKRTR